MSLPIITIVRALRACPRRVLAVGASAAARAFLPALALAGANATVTVAAERPPCVPPVAATAVATWSTEARCAIVPAAAGAENFGNKFPGEAAVYMGIVHAAIFDAAVAIEGGYRAFATEGLRAPANTSPEAAIATAAHHTLAGLYGPAGLSPAQRPVLDGDYAAYMDAIPAGEAKANGVALGEQVAAAVLAERADDGRDENPTLGDLGQPPPGPGVWEPSSAPAVGTRMPGIRPLALASGSQFRPDGPNPLTSFEYAQDFRQVKDLGRSDSTARSQEQTTQALFWTDHDIRQWNDGMLRLAAARGLGPVQVARMLAIAHIAGGDAMIGCFDAKYEYWFWRPHQAIPRADTDGNPFTEAASGWQPLRPTPNFPEYPSAHACHSAALAEALAAFFGTDHVALALDSRVSGTRREYDALHDIVKDVNRARVLAGFHFRNSDQEGSTLGRGVGRYVADHIARPAG